MKALGIAATGMLAQQTNVDVIANNIANANTTGFKSGRAAFQDLVYQSFASISWKFPMGCPNCLRSTI